MSGAPRPPRLPAPKMPPLRLSTSSTFGFFCGGARILHTGVVTGLHDRQHQQHSVLSIHEQVHREASTQRMGDDASYRSRVAMDCVYAKAKSPALDRRSSKPLSTRASQRMSSGTLFSRRMRRMAPP